MAKIFLSIFVFRPEIAALPHHRLERRGLERKTKFDSWTQLVVISDDAKSTNLHFEATYSEII